ncbi:MAG: heme-binding domain-containing protein [Chlorobi bacterium]|nr:heme-binding domain-containing protein [Chlorobiota bacterium]
MKKYLIIPLAAFVAVLFLNFAAPEKVQNTNATFSPGLAIPDDVQQIIDNHCSGCHSSDSKNEKAKKKLKFDKLTQLRKSKQVAKLGKIADVIKEDEMPPAKFLEHKPQAALSADQKTTLISWAESASGSLVK